MNFLDIVLEAKKAKEEKIKDDNSTLQKGVDNVDTNADSVTMSNDENEKKKEEPIENDTNTKPDKEQNTNANNNPEETPEDIDTDTDDMDMDEPTDYNSEFVQDSSDEDIGDIPSDGEDASMDTDEGSESNPATGDEGEVSDTSDTGNEEPDDGSDEMNDNNEELSKNESQEQKINKINLLGSFCRLHKLLREIIDKLSYEKVLNAKQEVFQKVSSNLSELMGKVDEYIQLDFARKDYTENVLIYTEMIALLELNVGMLKSITRQSEQ